MAIKIGSNIASVQAQRRLADTSSSLSKIFERLSSGQRINRVSDDAAGLSISMNLGKDARVFAQGMRNVNDAISVLSIADSALAEISKVTTRIRELAEQGSNGIYSAAQRNSFNQEAQSLSAELRRIVDTTEFNDQKLIDGSFSNRHVQIGYSTLQVTLPNVLGREAAHGDGTFNAVTSFPVSGSANSINSADLNKDGNADVITAVWGSPGTLTVQLGNGDGTFQTASSFVTPNRPESTVIGDFDEDGNLDVILSGDSVVFYKGDGAGGLAAAVTLYTPPGVGANGSQHITAGDLNGDGHLDLVSSGNNDDVLISLGNGNGTFQAASSFVFGGDFSSNPALYDVNNDSNLDLIVSGFNNSTVYVALGTGTGSFIPTSSYAAGGNASAALAADLDGDNFLDLISFNDDGGLYVRRGSGNGTFGAATTYNAGEGLAVPYISYPLLATDLNGDGAVDIAVATNSALKVFLNDGNGTFGAANSYAGLSSAQEGLTSADFNNDGAIDLAVSGLYLWSGNPVAGEEDFNFDLSTQSGARQALTDTAAMLEQLVLNRSTIGAYQARLDVSVNVLASAREQSLAAASRILDSDIAEESAELVRKQILLSAGAAVLSQANQEPKLALKLLNGI